jgi:hypothetical protein
MQITDRSSNYLSGRPRTCILMRDLAKGDSAAVTAESRPTLELLYYGT